MKAAKFVEPIGFAKRVVPPVGNPYQMAMFSFQSTGPTNIMTVNSVQSGKAYIGTNIRGRGDQKCARILEDNQARTNYLAMYGIIDTIDAAVGRYGIGNAYRCWKYYHTPANACHALTNDSAYSIIQQCTTGLCDEWYLEPHERMTPHKFQQTLASQMMTYKPDQGLYPGDDKTRIYTQLRKTKRSTIVKSQHKKRRMSIVQPNSNNTTETVSVHAFEEAVASGRLVSTLSEFESHANSKTVLTTKTGKRKCPNRCFVCGKNTNSYCTLCKRPGGNKSVPLCYFDHQAKKRW